MVNKYRLYKNPALLHKKQQQLSYIYICFASTPATKMYWTLTHTACFRTSFKLKLMLQNVRSLLRKDMEQININKI